MKLVSKFDLYKNRQQMSQLSKLPNEIITQNTEEAAINCEKKSK